MLIKFLILFAVAAFAPQILPGVKVKGLGTAALIAVVFGVLNFLMGWLVALVVTVLSIPALVVTMGLFAILIPTIVNTILIKVTDLILDDFEIKGWWPAIGMGLLFGLGVWLGDVLVR